MGILLVLLLAAHLIASRSFWKDIRHGRIPSTASFACVSVILYYDVGLAISVLGSAEGNGYLWELSSAGDRTLAYATALLFMTPFIFQFGASLVSMRTDESSKIVRTELREGAMKPLFYALALGIAVYFGMTGYQRIAAGGDLWALREEISHEFGPFILLLYLPLHLLAFYVLQKNSGSKFGLAVTSVLAISVVLSTMAIGQRTTVLLPVMIIALFRVRLSMPRLIGFAALGLLAASLLLASFKWQYAGQDNDVGTLVSQTLYNDFSRTDILASAIESSSSVGTSVLPYPGAGYIYAGLYYVPRWIAPFKGDATAYHFTAYVTHTTLDGLGWSFGIGAIEEAALNFGLYLVIPILFLYGIAMGLADQMCIRFPALVVPTRLGALWICGYHLPALVLLFGTMFLVIMALSIVFTDTRIGEGAITSEKELPQSAGHPIVARLSPKSGVQFRSH